jgi:hypothetical protein
MGPFLPKLDLRASHASVAREIQDAPRYLISPEGAVGDAQPATTNSRMMANRQRIRGSCLSSFPLAQISVERSPRVTFHGRGKIGDRWGKS